MCRYGAKNSTYSRVSSTSSVFAAYGKFVRPDLDISNMDGLLIENRTTYDRPPDQRNRLGLRDRTMMGDEEELVAIWAPNGSVVCLT